LERGVGGVLAAVGTPQPGVAGFRRSHYEASEARRVSLLQAQRREPVTHYRDVEVAALMSRDPEALRRFLTRTLGPLADAGESSERLRKTLSAYLAAGQQVAAAARRLGVHRNTVSYRLRALEDALGPVVDGDRVDLELALALCDRLGPVA
jgi:DNA-binding PucR family transcriptional regulator